MKHVLLALTVVLSGASVAGCTSDSGGNKGGVPEAGAGSGGTTSTGGTASTGGTTSTGGTASTGGSSGATGGASGNTGGTGGATSTGGASATGGASSSGGATDGGGSAGTGGTDGGSKDAGCTDVKALGSPVEETKVAEDMPTALGGTIADGTYVETSRISYTGAGGITGPDGDIVQNTFRITGTHFELIDGQDPTDAAAGTLAVSGTTFTVTETCPKAGDIIAEGSYTVAGDQLLIYIPSKSTLETFQKQ